jgi:hypothetical protein
MIALDGTQTMSTGARTVGILSSLFFVLHQLSGEAFIDAYTFHSDTSLLRTP